MADGAVRRRLGAVVGVVVLAALAVLVLEDRADQAPAEVVTPTSAAPAETEVPLPAEETATALVPEEANEAAAPEPPEVEPDQPVAATSEPPDDPTTHRLLVVDRANTPVVNATVETWADEDACESGSEPLSRNYTDATGRATVTLPPGRSVLLASAEGIGTSGMWDPWSLQRPARMADGETVITLRPTVRVSGTVIHADDRPAAFVPVHFWSSGGGAAPDPRTPPPIETDDQGHFDVQVDAGAYLGIAAIWQSEYSSKVRLRHIEPGSEHEVILRLPGAWGVRGVLLDATGVPVAGGTVGLWRHWPGRDMTGPPWPEENSYTKEATTDDEGRFVFDVDRLGSYALVGFHEDAAPSDTVVVVADDQRPVAEAVLRLYGAVTIQGHVLRPGGEPVAGVTVYGGMSGESTTARLYSPTASILFGFAHDQADEDGAFELGPLHPNGRYVVTAVPDPDHPRRSVSVHDVAGGTDDLELTLDEAALVRAWIEGVVVDAVTGEPVPGYKMEVAQQTPRGYLSRSDESLDPAGRFRVEGLTPGGVYALSIQAEGWAEGDVPWFTASEEGRNVRVELYIGGTLDVEVRDEAGQLVRLAQVQARRTSGAPSFWARSQRTGDSGRVRFEGMPGGEFAVSAVVGDRSGSVDVTLPPDGGEFVTVTLPPSEP